MRPLLLAERGAITAPELIRRGAETLAAHVAAAELPHLAGLVPEQWTGDMTEPFRFRPALRRRAHADAVRALAGVVEGGPEAPGHVSDWLRSTFYLVGELKPEPQAALLSLYERLVCERLPAVLGPGAVDAAPAVEAALDDLCAQFPAAASAFDALREVQKVPDPTGAGAERYWDESARAAPLFAIDWASFGREDLFEHGGRRAARWLVDRGFVTPDASALEIGCGAGRIQKHLSPVARHVFGVDISAEMVRLARERLAGLPNVTVLKTDGRRLDLPDESVDAAFSFLVFIHIHDPAVRASLLAEAARVLRPGGRLLLTLLAPERRLEALGRLAGFEVESAGPLDARAVNSFNLEPDWLWVFRRPRS